MPDDPGLGRRLAVAVAETASPWTGVNFAPILGAILDAQTQQAEALLAIKHDVELLKNQPWMTARECLRTAALPESTVEDRRYLLVQARGELLRGLPMQEAHTPPHAEILLLLAYVCALLGSGNLAHNYAIESWEDCWPVLDDQASKVNARYLQPFSGELFAGGRFHGGAVLRVFRSNVAAKTRVGRGFLNELNELNRIWLPSDSSNERRTDTMKNVKAMVSSDDMPSERFLAFPEVRAILSVRRYVQACERAGDLLAAFDPDGDFQPHCALSLGLDPIEPMSWPGHFARLSVERGLRRSQVGRLSTYFEADAKRLAATFVGVIDSGSPIVNDLLYRREGLPSEQSGQLETQEVDRTNSSPNIDPSLFPEGARLGIGYLTIRVLSYHDELGSRVDLPGVVGDRIIMADELTHGDSSAY